MESTHNILPLSHHAAIMLSFFMGNVFS